MTRATGAPVVVSPPTRPDHRLAILHSDDQSMVVLTLRERPRAAVTPLSEPRPIGEPALRVSVQ